MANIVVVGLRRSGVGAANLLVEQGHNVTVTDTKTKDELSNYTAALAPSVRLALGGHPEGLLESADLVVLSPGVPIDAPVVNRARANGVEIIGELELAYRNLSGLSFYAVTGTNGKSTTVTLLAMMLNASSIETILGGNIGTSLCSLVERRTDKTAAVVAEVSSFQLESTVDFHPRVAAVLNLTPDHLDRHGSMENYIAAKARIALKQDSSDAIVLNADEDNTRFLLVELTRPDRELPGIYYFSRHYNVKGIHLNDEGAIEYDIDGKKGVLIGSGEIGIKGVHNLENAMAASLMALLAGASAKAVVKVLREFKGLEHRVEFVATKKGVSFYNDSKGTNVPAVEKSLMSFDAPVVLIAGGRDKHGDFSPLAPLLAQRGRAVVLIGEAADAIERAVGASIKCTRAATMAEAVEKASSLAHEGDVVLLSPACASFDMFADFEDRGRCFKEAVSCL